MFTWTNYTLFLLVKRVKKDQVDLSGKVGLDIAGWYAKDAIDEAIEYYVWDWEMGESPELSSTLFTVVNDQWTYGNEVFGPDSDGDNFVIDPRYVKFYFLYTKSLNFMHL